MHPNRSEFQVNSTSCRMDVIWSFAALGCGGSGVRAHTNTHNTEGDGPHRTDSCNMGKVPFLHASQQTHSAVAPDDALYRTQLWPIHTPSVCASPTVLSHRRLTRRPLYTCTTSCSRSPSLCFKLLIPLQ